MRIATRRVAGKVEHLAEARPSTKYRGFIATPAG
jgi:hypothetical protein